MASSIATSHHQTTTKTLSLKIGKEPSQIAQAEIHLCRYSLSQGISKRLAIAPVAIIIDLVCVISSHEKTS
jgi:hypothetical protein